MAWPALTFRVEKIAVTKTSAMKKITGTLLFVLLSAGIFGQALIPPAYVVNKSSAVNINAPLLYHSGRAPLIVQNSTFSKAYVLPSESSYDDDRDRTFFGNILWGGLSGMIVGIGVTYPINDDGYRPTFQEVRNGAVLGTAAGVAVGLVAGIIKAAKRKKSNAL